MSSTSTRTLSASPGGVTMLRWRSWPVRDNPRQALGVALLLVAVGMFVYVLTEQATIAAVAVAALVAAMWQFFVPARFEIDSDGIWRNLFGWYTCFAWQDICRYEVDDDGVVLRADDDPSPLAYLRSVAVPWRGHRAELLAALHARLDKPEQELERADA